MNTFLSKVSLCTGLLLVSVFGITLAQDTNENQAVRSYVLTTDQTQSIEIPNQGAQENTTHTVITLDVSRIGQHEYAVQFTNIESSRAGSSADSLIGLRATLTLDEKGDITESSGLDGNAYVSGSGGVASMEEILQGLFLVMPEVHLEPGVSWTRSVDIPSEQNGLKLARTTDETFKCERITDFEGAKVFEVSASNKVSLTGGGNQGGQEVDVDIEGKLTATLLVDVTTGLIVHSENTGKMQGFIGLPTASLPVTMSIEGSLIRK